MLTQNEETSSATNLEAYADKDLERFILEQEKALEGRKLIAETLLFVGCQVLSNALAILLFQYAVRVWVTYLLVWAISLSPAMADLCNVHFDQLEGGWKITIMKSPFKTAFKLIFGVGVLSVGIHEVRDLIVDTAYGINQVYSEIRAYEHPKSGSYDLIKDFNPLTTLILATAVVFASLYLKDRK